MKNKLFNLANMSKYGYINRALSKISKLALTGYKSQQAYCPKGLFFVRKISMRSHLNGEAGEGHIYVCRSPVEPVCQPFSALPPII